ncbi:MAG: Gfo/Idh/MocA family oxidoreductase [Burkholderiaceae bacterium]|nr:Gfo/Idh/MocA family oxidoreductase [Burkholderiaceae bacterium]
MRFGILGNAKIARTQVIPAMLQAGHTPVSLGSRGPMAPWDGAPPMRWTDYAGVLNDPQVQAVYIALPNHLHTQWTVAALHAGKHVLCEKPMALSTEESAQIQAAMQATGRHAVEAYMVRHHPQWQWLRQAELGDIRQIQVVFNYDNRDAHNIRNALPHGGGALWDIGCYAVFAGHWLMGKSPDLVDARMQRHPTWGVDLHTQGTLSWHAREGRGAAHLQFMVSTQSAKSQSVYVVGERGWAQLHAPFNPPHGPGVSTATWASQAGLHHEAHTLTFEPCNAYANMVCDFAARVASGQTPSMQDSPDITHTLCRLIEASAGQSARSALQ